MFKKIPIYPNYSLKETLSFEELRKQGLGHIPFILDSIHQRLLLQTKIPIRGFYGIVYPNSDITVVVETNFKNPMLGKEFSFSVAHTPHPTTLVNTGTAKSITETLEETYNKTVQTLLN